MTRLSHRPWRDRSATLLVLGVFIGCAGASPTQLRSPDSLVEPALETPADTVDHPGEGQAVDSAGTDCADRGEACADSLSEAVPGDSTDVGVPIDSLTAPGDSLSTPGDSLTTPGDSLSTPVDSSHAAPLPPDPRAAGPRVFVDTRMPAAPAGGRRLAVRAGGNLQAALDSARLGDVLLLEPGATFTGNFVLRDKGAGDGWIVVRPDLPDAALPAPGTRLTPTAAAALALPRLVTPNAESAVRTAAGAHHFRLVGLELTAGPAVAQVNGGIVEFGEGQAQKTAASVPHHLVVDRSYVHGHGALHLKRCVTLNSGAAAVVDSHLAECHGRGQDTQAILGYNGPGPFKIVNNYLADAAEIIMFGGADPSIPDLIPSDIEIRGNHLTNTPAMRQGWLVKNLFELKAAQRVLFEGNVLENVWVHGQTGFAVKLKGTNQSGTCKACAVRDVTMRGNVIRNAAAGISVGNDNPLQATERVLIQHTVFEQIGGNPSTDPGRLFQFSDRVEGLVIERNTGTGPKAIAVTVGGPITGFVMVQNRFGPSANGFDGADGTPHGLGTLDARYPGYVVRDNVFAGLPANRYPAGNFFPSSLAAAPALADGRPIGADEALVKSLTARAVVTW